MAAQRWPRKNDAASIRARQQALGLGGEVASHDLTPWARAQEALTGVAVIPVSVVGPVVVEPGPYELPAPDGEVVEGGRQADGVFVAIARITGGLSARPHRTPLSA